MNKLQLQNFIQFLLFRDLKGRIEKGIINRNKRLMGLSIILPLFFTSCVSITGLEEGRTLGENNIEISGSLNMSSIIGSTEDDDYSDSETMPLIPNMEGKFKYGISDDMDLGVRINSNYNFSAFAKFKLSETEKGALSAGMELATVGGFSYAFHLPLFFSHYPNSHVALNFSPRYIYQSPTLNDSGTGLHHFGANTGVFIGRNNKVGFDIGYYSNKIGRNLFTIGVGGIFKIQRPKTGCI